MLQEKYLTSIIDPISGNREFITLISEWHRYDNIMNKCIYGLFDSGMKIELGRYPGTLNHKQECEEHKKITDKFKIIQTNYGILL